MKKKLLAACGAVLALGIAASFLIPRALDTRAWRPFGRLTTEDVATISVYNCSLEKTAALTPAETDKAIELLRGLTVYGRPIAEESIDYSNMPIGGEACIRKLAIRFADGSVQEFMAGWRFLTFIEPNEEDTEIYRCDPFSIADISNFCTMARKAHFPPVWNDQSNCWVPG